MERQQKRVALPTSFRVVLNTPRRLRWLLVASVVLHLFFTPMASWVGVLALLWPEQAEALPPEEELETIPIELFQDTLEDSTDSSADDMPPLPEEDPIGLIEEIVPEVPSLPVQPKPAATPAPTPEPSTTAPASSTTSTPPDEEPDTPVEPTDAGAPKAEPGETEVAQRRERRTIEEPVALAGKTAQMVEKQAYVSIVLYADRIREHAVGRRIAAVLPTLPQWRDFFPDGTLNPVRDFDRVMVIGPSFFNSANVVAALQYNIEPKKVRAAIDLLVRRKGEWLKGTPVPAALAHADRAERLFVMPSPGLVVVVPPKLKKGAFEKGLGIPAPKGPEAMVASLVNPWKPLARYNLKIPKTVKDVKIRLTPLAGGEVKLELLARDESPEAAKATAKQMTDAINALADFTAGVSSILELTGFGRTVTMPRFELHPKEDRIWGEQVLNSEQVEFLLTQLERQAMLWNQPRPRRGAGAKPGGGAGAAPTAGDGRKRAPPKAPRKNTPQKATPKASPKTSTPAPKKLRPAAPRGGVTPAPTRE